MNFPFQFADGAAHHAMGDVVAVFDITGKQRLVANGVDEPRNAPAVKINPPQRGPGEIRRALRAGQFQPVLDVLGHLEARERGDDNAR